MYMKKGYPGFTLIELIVVMVLIGIMFSLVGPSFLNYSRSQDLTQSHQEFQTFLSEAFSESRSGGKLVAVTANSRSSEVVRAEYDYSICCPSGICEFGNDCDPLPDTQNIYTLEGGVKMVQPESGLGLFFVPPHGDISWNGAVEEDRLDVLLADEYENEKSFSIYRRSGLIDASTNRDE